MLREMPNIGIYPDVCTFNVLVDALSKKGKAKEAEEVLEVMIERGVDPNVVTYNSLMDGYCLQGQMDEAMRVFNKMVDMGVQPSILSHHILINGYCKEMKIDVAMHLFREMPERGFKPDVQTFSTVLQGLFQDGWMKLKSFLWKWNKMVAFQMVGLTMLLSEDFLRERSTLRPSNYSRKWLQRVFQQTNLQFPGLQI